MQTPSQSVSILNFDILDLVCQELYDKRALVSISQTCSTLRQSAVRRLLSMGPIIIGHEHSLRLLHRFVSADPTNRYPYVRMLDLSIPCLYACAGEGTSQRIADIIQQSTCLETLFLRYCDFLFSLPDFSKVVAAINALTSLRRIRFNMWNDQVTSIVRHMQSPIRRLEVGDISQVETDDDCIALSRLEPVVGPLAATIEALHLPSVYLHPGSPFQFPRVRSLGIDRSADRPSLDALLRMFPGLSGGSLSIACHVFVDGDPLNEDAEQTLVRSENRDRQVERSWTHLDRLDADPIGLYMLGLRCPVRVLNLRCSPCWTQEPHVVEVLRDTKPCCLRLSAWVSDTRSAFIDSVPPEVAQRMTHLSLNMALLAPSAVSGRSTHQDEFSITALLVSTNSSSLPRRILTESCFVQGRVMHVLKSTRLTHLHVAITTDPAAAKQLWTDFMLEIRVLDLNTWAAQFACALPNLRFIAFTIDPYAAFMYTFARGWRVMRGSAAVPGASSGGPVVELLDYYATRQVLRDEELVL